MHTPGRSGGGRAVLFVLAVLVAVYGLDGFAPSGFWGFGGLGPSVDFAAADVRCPAGYSRSGAVCRKRVHATVIVSTERVCHGMRRGSACTRTVTMDATAKRATQRVCIDDLTYLGCMRSGYWRTVGSRSFCSTSASSGRRCTTVGRYRTRIVTVYVCPTGYRSVGSICYKTVNGWRTYTSGSCPSGYIRLTTGRSISCHRYVTAAQLEHTHTTTRRPVTTTTRRPRPVVTTTITTTTIAPRQPRPVATTTTTTTAPRRPRSAVTTTTRRPVATTTTTTTVSLRCASGEHAHNPDFGGGVHPLGLKNTQAHRDLHGGGARPTGCSGDHPALPRSSVTGLATSATAVAGSVYTDPFTVTGVSASVSGSGCSLAGPSGSAGSHVLRVERSVAGTAVCVVRAGSVSVRVRVVFEAAASRVVITGLGNALGVSPIDLGFSVDPDDAECEALHRGVGSVEVLFVDNAGSDRMVRVDVGSRIGDVKVTVYCRKGSAEMDVTVNIFVVPAVCERPVAVGGRVRDGWVSTCLSSQRGDNETVYYARRYTFSLATAGRVSVSMVSDEAASVYVLSVPHSDSDVPHAVGKEKASVDLSAGDYVVEVVLAKPRSFDGRFVLDIESEVKACAVGEVRVFGGWCVTGTVYEFTESTIVMTREAAIQALEEKKCGSLTVNQLAGLMLAIPVRELQLANPSPMSLGRSDNLKQNRTNKALYSRGTRESERRAHWHPGVGLWQLDTFEAAKNLNHAERADVLMGGKGVAQHIRDHYCDPENKSKWIQKVYGPWLGCIDKSNSSNSDRSLCGSTYSKIYDKAKDSLRVRGTEGSDRDGGVQDLFCAWGTKKPAAHIIGFKCHLYDPMKREGNMHVADPEGTDSASRPNGFTPLAVAFISLTSHEGIKYAVFPKSHTGYDYTLIRGVPKNKYSRNSALGLKDDGWYEDNLVDDPNDDLDDNLGGLKLYVRSADDENCGAVVGPLVAMCVWIDPTAKSLLD